MQIKYLSVPGTHPSPVSGKSDAVKLAASKIADEEVSAGKITLSVVEVNRSPSEMIVLLLNGEGDDLRDIAFMESLLSDEARDAAGVGPLGLVLVSTEMLGRIEDDGTVLSSGCRLPASTHTNEEDDLEATEDEAVEAVDPSTPVTPSAPVTFPTD